MKSGVRGRNGSKGGAHHIVWIARRKDNGVRLHSEGQAVA